MSVVLKWALVSLFVTSALLTILLTGKPRKALTPGDVAIIVTIQLGLAIGVVIWL
jgi:hypothetical protein